MTDVAAQPADTPIKTPSFPPPATSDRIKAFIGDLARPFALYAISLATAKAIWGGSASDVIGAAGLILAALYGAKAYEVTQQGKQQAEVAKVQAQSGS